MQVDLNNGNRKVSCMQIYQEVRDAGFQNSNVTLRGIGVFAQEISLCQMDLNRRGSVHSNGPGTEEIDTGVEEPSSNGNKEGRGFETQKEGLGRRVSKGGE